MAGAFALNPRLFAGGEVSGQADAGSTSGVYLQLSINPGYTVALQSASPVTISLPVILGRSGTNYYECGTPPTFGSVQFGPVFPVPSRCPPKSFGTWTVKGAAELLFLGETLQPLNENNMFKPIGRIGISAVY
jgi:hypothetical protein